MSKPREVTAAPSVLEFRSCLELRRQQGQKQTATGKMALRSAKSPGCVTKGHCRPRDIGVRDVERQGRHSPPLQTSKELSVEEKRGLARGHKKVK